MTILDKAAEAAAAHARWVAAGCPLRDEQEIERVYSICEPCEQFRKAKEPGKSATCAMCGCYLRKYGIFMNKIALATEVCPLGKWK